MFTRSLSRIGFKYPTAVSSKPLLFCHNARYSFSATQTPTNAVIPPTSAAATITPAPIDASSLDTAVQVVPDVASITAQAAKSIRIEDMGLFSNAYLGDNDIANVLETVKPLGHPVAHDFIDKLSAISPSNLYTHLDEFSRDALLYLSNDLGWGMGLSIIAISLSIKFTFMPLMLGTQVNALKL